MIFIEDWYDFLTPTILNYFVQFRNSPAVKYSKTFDYHYLTLRLNRKTGEIFNYTREMIDDEEFYASTHELVLPIKQTNSLLTEVNQLTKNKYDR